MLRTITIIAALFACGSNWSPAHQDHADVVVDVDHWSPFGGNEVHRINGWFMDYSIKHGVWETNVRVLETHPMIDRETREGIRVASRCRIVGKWMDSNRRVILPRRVEVIQRRGGS